jgi:guanylate kinase
LHKIIIIAGPSGAGKTTVSHYLTKQYKIPRVITHTTRPMRTGEIAGQSYYFESEASFKKLHFFEHVRYGSYQYGSSRESLENAWSKNELVSLIVETDGARSYLRQLPEQTIFLYLTVSNLRILAARLEQRGDDPAEITKRLASPEFKRDLQLPKDLESKAITIVTDDWKRTKQELDHLIRRLQRDL